MQILEFAGICVIVLVAILVGILVGIFVRRRLLMVGGGTIRLQVRLSTMIPGRGWATGIGQFVADELRFHRMFSFAVRPKRVLYRDTLVVHQQRLPEGPERLTIPGHWIVLRCTDGAIQSQVEIAMASSTVTGFLSWLEAAPPGQPGSVAPRPTIHPRSRPIER